MRKEDFTGLKDGSSYVMRHRLSIKRPMSIYNNLVRLFTKGDCDHSFTVFFENGQPYFYEAVAKGVKKHSYNEFIDHHRFFYIRELKSLLSYEEKNKRLEDQVGKSYDYKDGVACQAVYQKSGIWCGDDETKAMEDWYCSELTAYAEGIKNFMVVSPKYLNKKLGIGEWISL